LTAHGSAAEELVLVGPAVGAGDPGVAAAAVEWAAVVVACGVLATVESPDPQPLAIAAMTAAAATTVNRRTPQCRLHTTWHRTLTSPVDEAGVAERRLVTP
jgi:hypothetical protein